MLREKTTYLQLVGSLLVGLFCCYFTYSIYSRFSARHEYLYWDPAEHAYYGVRIALDLRRFEILSLLRDTNEQILWPPLHSYLQAPFQLIWGPNFYSASLSSLAAYLLFFPAVTWLYQQMHSSWAGWLSLMALVATSPFYAGFASAPMLEIFGATLTAVSLALYLRNSRWFPFSLTLLFFLKYNYCLYLLLPVAFEKLVPLLKRFRINTPQLHRWITPFPLFVVAYLLMLVLIQFTGGLRIGPVSIHGTGNLVVILVWIILIRAAIKGYIRRYWSEIRQSDWVWFFVPVLAWMLFPIPNRIKSMISFSISKPLSGLSPDQFSYYSFYFEKLQLYFSNGWAACACILVAGTTCILFWKRREVRIPALMFLLPLLLMTLNQNKAERFLFTFVFPLWLLSSYGISSIRKNVSRFAATVLLCVLAILMYDRALVRKLVGWPLLPRERRGPVDFVAKAVSGASEIRVLGVTNELSKALLSYHIGRASDFAINHHFDWELEQRPPAGTSIITINSEIGGNPVIKKKFADGTMIRHYVWK